MGLAWAWGHTDSGLCLILRSQQCSLLDSLQSRERGPMALTRQGWGGGPAGGALGLAGLTDLSS